MSRGGGDENDDNLFDNDNAGIGHVTGWDENSRRGHEDRIEGSRTGTPQHEAAKGVDSCRSRIVDSASVSLESGLQLVSDETGVMAGSGPKRKMQEEKERGAEVGQVLGGQDQTG
jgi:hypothetical protein